MKTTQAYLDGSPASSYGQKVLALCQEYSNASRLHWKLEVTGYSRWSLHSFDGVGRPRAWTLKFREKEGRGDRDDKFYIEVYREGVLVKEACFWDFWPDLKHWRTVLDFLTM